MTALSLLRLRLRRYWAVHRSRSQMQATKKMGRNSRRSSAAGSNLLKLVIAATFILLLLFWRPNIFEATRCIKDKDQRQSTPSASEAFWFWRLLNPGEQEGRSGSGRGNPCH
mmetsp:Transcript_12607/g.18085  ORF Transcript_12607/g.18085 Transcript_12607/m.18085 type:complete len:112 (-) Transcript_12607:237-572(-)